jgi:hypothetical protein
MSEIIITERQLAIITKEELSTNPKLVKESEWYNTVGDIVGIVDPTGIVDIVNGISYFTQGDHLFGLLSIVSAIPYAGDVVAKPVMGALKIGSTATKELNVAMKLAKLGKTTEASASLAKLAKEPGVVGKFLQSAKSWAPKVASKIEQVPAGPLKGFKNTILDYLKLLENAGAKSAKFQKSAGNLAKYIGHAAKPAENIKALQSLLKDEKLFKGLTKKGPLTNIFIGGAPRLFGDRRMRILMRQTKWWLGFLDYIGVANFVGPDELAAKMGEEGVRQKMEEYNKTPQARQNATEDFGNQSTTQQQSNSQSQTNTQSSSGTDPIQGMMQNIFGGQLKNAALMAL